MSINDVPPCDPPKTFLGKLLLKIKIFLTPDDGETLVCQHCGRRLYVD